MMKSAALNPPGSVAGQRSGLSLRRLLLGALFLSLFAGFVALGTWQVHRLQWKTALIERVESRVLAEPVPAPGIEHWANIKTESDEYRHVSVSGRFLHALSTPVFASTEFGNGYWLLTPLRLDAGGIVLVNRGFISQKAVMTSQPPTMTRVTLTGLLRMTEPGGGFLRSNRPDAGRWYSRDVQAIGAARGLYSIAPVAPYFIDANAALFHSGKRLAGSQPLHEPVPGLTVIHFHNNHLVYALTWYTLALMTAIGGVWILRMASKP